MSELRRIGILGLAMFASIGGAGFVTGLLLANARQGGGLLPAPMIALLAVGALFTIGGGVVTFRLLRRMTREASATPRGRKNMILYMAFGGIGLVLAVLMLIGGGMPPSLLDDGPLPAAFAIGLAAIIGIMVPALSLYWHLRIVDEQEAAAYRTGAMLAMYAFWIGAPVWWLLWRGGLVPAPDGIILYFMTALVALIVWLWGKYR